MGTYVIECGFAVFEARPKKPPSISQAKQQQVKQEGIFKILFKMFKKPSFLFFTVSYGLNVASYIGMVTLLNELIVGNFPVSSHFCDLFSD